MMARPSTTPRLATLDPASVAEHVVQLVLQHIARLEFVLSPGDIGMRAPAPSDSFSTLRLTVTDLVTYAKVGELGDWTEPDGPRDAIQEICSALYGCAGQPGTFGVGAIEESVSDAALEDAIGVALVGAWARAKLAERGAKLTARELGVLAGMDAQNVRLLARKGELTLEDGALGRAEARRWLSGRGVPGVR
jgi:hypothetical protein